MPSGTMGEQPRSTSSRCPQRSSSRIDRRASWQLHQRGNGSISSTTAGRYATASTTVQALFSAPTARRFQDTPPIAAPQGLCGACKRRAAWLVVGGHDEDDDADDDEGAASFLTEHPVHLWLVSARLGWPDRDNCRPRSRTCSRTADQRRLGLAIGANG